MSTTTNLTDSFEHLMDLAERATLRPGAALNAVFNLGEEGRALVAQMMAKQLPEAYGEGTKAPRIRGACIREAKRLVHTNRSAAFALRTLRA